MCEKKLFVILASFELTATCIATVIQNTYIGDMIKTGFTLQKSEKLNKRIYQEFARKINDDPSIINGTGTWR